MIRLPDRKLSKPVREKLGEYQREIDVIVDYPTKVETAERKFSNYNRKGSATFDAVKSALTKMCSGAQRCAYCEDSAADEVEHVKPKNLYPEAAFVWPNYIYACGPCNGPKSNHYAVFEQGTGRTVEVGRRPKAPVLPPAPGRPVLIDPRAEDPCAFMGLDLRDTFYFVPRAKVGSIDYERAEYTIRTLRLNIREYLPKARQQAFEDYHAHLSLYRVRREQGASTRQLSRLQKHLLERGHPTVWYEMKRQHDAIRPLKEIFGDVPEALGW